MDRHECHRCSSVPTTAPTSAIAGRVGCHLHTKAWIIRGMEVVVPQEKASPRLPVAAEVAGELKTQHCSQPLLEGGRASDLELGLHSPSHPSRASERAKKPQAGQRC